MQSIFRVSEVEVKLNRSLFLYLFSLVIICNRNYTEYQQVDIIEASCPLGCYCLKTVPMTWHHKQCGDPVFINEYGDIFFKNLNSCNGFFILNTKFQCEVSSHSTYQYFKNFSYFGMALAQVIQSAELNLSGHEQVKFITTINQKALKRWID